MLSQLKQTYDLSLGYKKSNHDDSNFLDTHNAATIQNEQNKLDTFSRGPGINNLQTNLHILLQNAESKINDDLKFFFKKCAERINNIQEESPHLQKEFQSKMINLTDQIELLTKNIDLQIQKIQPPSLKTEELQNSKSSNFYQSSNQNLDKSKSQMMSSTLRFKASHSMNQLVSKEIRCSTQTNSALLTSLTSLLDNLLIGTSEGQILIYHQQSFEKQRQIQAHEAGVSLITQGLVEGEQIIITGSHDKSIKVFSISIDSNSIMDLNLMFKLSGHHGVILGLVVANDVQQRDKYLDLIISSSADNTVRVWDAQTGDVLMNFTGHQSDVHGICYSKKHNVICSGSNDKSIRIWHASDYSVCRALKKLYGHKDSIMGLIIPEEDGDLIVSCSLDKTIKVWNILTDQAIRTIQTNIMLTQIIYLQPGSVAVLSFGNQIDLYDYVISTNLSKIKTFHKVSNIYVDGQKIYTVEVNNINLYY